MTRLLISFIFISVFTSCAYNQGESTLPVTPDLPSSDKIVKTDAEWKEILTDEEFDILRKHGTERPNTGEYNDYKGKGTFVCKACQLPLFEGKTKYESGSGWPAFYDCLPENVATQADHSLGSTRTEVHCARCNGHLGHVFTDGPKPTGLRYCVNSLSIQLEEK